MLRTALIVACASWTGVLAAGGTVALGLHFTGNDPLAYFRPTAPSSFPACPPSALDPAEADQLHREFMRGPREPTAGGQRF